MSFGSSMVGNSGFNSGPAGSGIKKGKIAGYNSIQTPNLSPDQMGLFNFLLGNIGKQGLGQGLGKLSSLAGGDQSAFEDLEAPAKRQFNKFAGDLGSRFSGLGSGAQQSSGFQNSLSEGAADLSERLQSQRLGYQQQALRDLLGLSQGLIGEDLYDTVLSPKKEGFWSKLFGGLSGGVGSGVGQLGGLYGGKKLGLF